MKTVQGETTLTVSESKRLIAKGVCELGVVKRAMKSGLVVITKGTTNCFVAGELAGIQVDRAGFVLGRTYPRKGGKKLGAPAAEISEIVLRNGKVSDMTMDQAMDELGPGDVVIKGANYLDYEAETAGVLIGHPTSGTVGKILPVIAARKAHLVIPVGLEKCVVTRASYIEEVLRDPIEVIGGEKYSAYSMRGIIVTELEALGLLAGVTVCQVAAGGIGGAEGGVRLLFRGARDQVKTALRVLEGIHGEPAFI